MNNSIKRKINQNYKFNFGLSELSSTSSDFMSKSNYIKKPIKQNGGRRYKCCCNDLFKSLKNKNFELILYILRENNCCFKCQDSNGNNGLHLLIPYYRTNKEIANMVDEILLNADCEDFINIQNNKGRTPMFVAVENNLDELAEKMEDAGADPEIKDLQGNFVGEKSSKGKLNEMDDNDEPESNIKKNIMNIYSFVVPKSTANDLTSLNLDDIKNITTQDKSLDTDNFMQDIKLKINRALGTDDTSTTDNETIPKPNLIQTSDTLNSDKFLALLGRDNEPMVVSYSDTDDNTDQFIATLTNKYNAINETDKSIKKPKITNPRNVEYDTLGSLFESSDIDKISLKHKQPLSTETSLDEIISDNKIKKLVNETTTDDLIKSDIKKKTSNNFKKLESETSSNSLHTDLEKYIDETTSVESIGTKAKSKYNVFLKKENSYGDKNLDTTEIDTNTLLGVIKKIQDNNITESENLLDMIGGGSKKNEQHIIGHRKLILNNLKKTQGNKSLNSDDYNELYNSDSEFGTKSKKSKKLNNELSRMMISQKEKIHKEVLEMIMGMLNKGLITQSNKPLEPSERNAKLIKAYIYRQISEKNPQMGGMDKIMMFKAMSENDIINAVKKMPELDELEKTIQKHLEDKKTNKKSIDVSETVEASEISEELKKPKKKSSKK